MKLNIILSALVLATGTIAAVPATAIAQTHSIQAAHARNGQAADALKARIATVQTRVAEGRRSGKVSRAQASRLERQVTQVRTSMTRLNRKQGFVSAAELATYNRTLGQVDVALDGHGVPRGYGSDGLMAPSSSR